MNAAHQSAIRRTAKKAASFLAACGIAGSFALASVTIAPTAIAGPDDGIGFVATEGHVDGPKAYWNSAKNNFELRVEQGDTAALLEDTVNWIGKGFGRVNQYTFEVGGGATREVAHQDFLGNPGDLLYWSPQVTSRGAPIWAGYGADAGIPAELFRDKTFSMDIVGWNGPGRYEAFSMQLWPEEGFRRMWSSHTPGLRSTSVQPGNHTHNHSTFSKPGRYEATYQVTARDTDGNRIASQPQTLVWQVGGTRPNPNGIGDVVSAYNAANNEGLPPNPSLKMRPHQGNGTLPAEQYLTDLVFTTGDESNDGTAVFYIDGYFLAEVPVENGTAIWPEMIGQGTSSFQVVYVPATSGARWISAPLSYRFGQAETSVTELGEFPQENPTDPAPAFDNGDINVTDARVTLSATPAEDGLLRVTVQPADDRISVAVEPADISSECELYFTSAPEQRSALVEATFCEDPFSLRLTPTSRASVGATTGTVTPGKSSVVTLGDADSADGDEGNQGDEGHTAGTEPSTTPGDSATQSPAPQPPKVIPPKPPKQEPEASGHNQGNIPTETVEISKGHIDLGPVIYDDKSIRFMVGDDSRQHAATKVYRRPDDVTMKVGEVFRRTLKEQHLARGLDFLGSPGEEIYLIAQGQLGQELWPGFSSEHAGGVPYNFEFEPVSHPEGAHWWAFTNAAFGGVQEMIANSAGASVLRRDEPVHLHNNWVFTKPGTYRIRMRAVQSNASERATEWETITFVVGEPNAGSGAEEGGADAGGADAGGADAGGADAGGAGADESGAPTPSQSTTSSSPTSATTSTQQPRPTTTSTTRPNLTTTKPPTASTTSGTSTAEPAPQPPTTGTPKPAPKPQPPMPPQEIPQQRLKISTGHIDLGPVYYTDSSVRFMVGDDSRQHANTKVFRRPEDVTFLVESKQQRTISAAQMRELGGQAEGETVRVHLLPDTPEDGSLWPGFSSEHANNVAYDFEIAPQSTPAGGQWWAFNNDPFGSVSEIIGSSQGPTRVQRAQPVHFHNNWLFTKPGTYTMKMRAIPHGQNTGATEWTTVTFEVAEGETTPIPDKPAPGTGNSPTSGNATSSVTPPPPGGSGGAGSDKPGATNPGATPGGAGSGGAGEGGAGPQPTQQPRPPQATGEVVISKGHVDLGPVSSGSGVEFLVGDDSRQHSEKKEWRRPEEVVLAVGDHMSRVLDSNLLDGSAFPLGRAGERIYLLPQAPTNDELWPGFSSEHADGQGYNFEIAPVDTPAGGSWWAFTGSAKNPTEIFGSSEGPSTIIRQKMAHLHNSWIFTKPGTYTMRMRAVAHSNPDTKTEWATVTFRVGGTTEAAGAPAGSRRPGGSTPGAAGARPAPPAPSLKPGAGSASSSGSAPAATGGSSGAAARGGAKAASSGGASRSTGAGAANPQRPGAGAARTAQRTPEAGKKAGKGPEKQSEARIQAATAAPTSTGEIIARIAGMTCGLIGIGLGGFAAWRRFH